MSVRTVINKGPSDNRIDIIILGDGYTASEINTTYNSHVNTLTDYLFSGGLLSQPFGRYVEYFNVHVVDVVSLESGADNPNAGIARDTALNASFNFDGETDRLLYVDHGITVSTMNTALSGTGIGAEMRFVTINEAKYGGGGGYFAAYAGGNVSALEVALHELGHSFANLADEYGGNASTYTGPDPLAVNVTTDSTGAKWSNWIGYNQEGIGVIGAYEGGRYFDAGVYRPSISSKMRDLDKPFDAISREAFILEFYKYVDPLDSYSYSTTTGPLVDIETLSVTPIDTDIIKLEWFVDGASVKTGVTSLSVSDLNLSLGTHTISAKAFDPTDWVRADRSSLEQNVDWTVTITKPPGFATKELITKIYTGYYNRAPDPEGLAYWIGRSDAGMSAADIAQSYSVQPESTANYPYLVNPTLEGTTGFITAVYANLFNRAPDVEGLLYWISQLEAGRPVGSMILDIINGAVTAPDKTILDNKVIAGIDWATDAAADAGFTYNGLAAASARAVLAGINENTSSVDAARTATDAFFAFNNPPVEQVVDFVYLATAPGEALSLVNMENQVETVGQIDDVFYAVA